MGSPLSLVVVAAAFNLSSLLWLGEVGRPLSLRDFMWSGVTLSVATDGRDRRVLFSKSSSERKIIFEKNSQEIRWKTLSNAIKVYCIIIMHF